jgi:small subunit ribosomal protein S9
MDYYEGIGRRKTATARVRLYPGGDGTVTVNDRPATEYFTVPEALVHLTNPLKAVAMERRFNIIARALLKVDPGLRPLLRQKGFLTRDARVKERKKPGLKRARKAPQYTKR